MKDRKDIYKSKKSEKNIDMFRSTEILMEWCLDKAWKIANHNHGYTDWSKMTKEQRESIFEEEIKIAEIMMNHLGLRMSK